MIRNELVVRGQGIRKVSEGHPSRSIRGLTSSFISVTGEQRTQSTLVYCRDTITVQTGTLTETKRGMEMMTGKSFRNTAKGTAKECCRDRERENNMEKGDGGSLFSGDRQGKVVLS